jgi:ubiquinone/menaquinone biosynthesis C-methylase UbiE
LRDAWARKRRIARRYDRTADLYDGLYAEEQRHKYAQLTPEVLPTKGHSVLDVGCGTGLLMEELASKAKFLVGVDISRKMLLKASSRLRAVGNSHLVLADSDFLPFRAGTFTHALSFTLLQNVPRPLSTLREVVRTARLNAIVVISTPKESVLREELRGLLPEVGLRLLRVLDEGKDVVTVCSKSDQALPPTAGLSLRKPQ